MEKLGASPRCDKPITTWGPRSRVLFSQTSPDRDYNTGTGQECGAKEEIVCSMFKYISAEVALLFAKTLRVRFTQPSDLNDPFEAGGPAF